MRIKYRLIKRTSSWTSNKKDIGSISLATDGDKQVEYSFMRSMPETYTLNTRSFCGSKELKIKKIGGIYG